jgi:hypothetical protein
MPFLLKEWHNMKYLTLFILVFHFNLHAQDKEADLQLPVSDVSQIQKQEEEMPPTLDQVEMKQTEKKSEPTKKKTIEKTKQSIPE